MELSYTFHVTSFHESAVAFDAVHVEIVTVDEVMPKSNDRLSFIGTGTEANRVTCT